MSLNSFKTECIIHNDLRVYQREASVTFPYDMGTSLKEEFAWVGSFQGKMVYNIIVFYF